MNFSPRDSDLQKEDSIPTASDDSLDVAYDPQKDEEQMEDEYEEEFEEHVSHSKLPRSENARLQRPIFVNRQAPHPPSSNAAQPYSSGGTIASSSTQLRTSIKHDTGDSVDNARGDVARTKGFHRNLFSQAVGRESHYDPRYSQAPINHLDFQYTSPEVPPSEAPFSKPSVYRYPSKHPSTVHPQLHRAETHYSIRPSLHKEDFSQTHSLRHPYLSCSPLHLDTHGMYREGTTSQMEEDSLQENLPQRPIGEGISSQQLSPLKSQRQPVVTRFDTRRFREEDRRLVREQVGNNNASTSGGKCYVVYPDQNGQIVGGCLGKEKFMECLKQLCQRLLDVSLLKVKDQLQPRIDMVRRQMDEKFDYRDHQLDTSWFVNEIGVVLKRIRSELHAMWKKGGSSRDAPAPPGIEIDQWHRLIDYWMSENFLKLSMRMKDNRKKVQIGNVTGRSGNTGLIANLKRKRGSTPPLHEIQEEIEIRKYHHQAKAGIQGMSETTIVQEGGQSDIPVSAVDEVKKKSRPDLYNSLLHLQTTQNEMKQEQLTIQKEQRELSDGLMKLSSKMDDLMKILVGEKQPTQPSRMGKGEDVPSSKMEATENQSKQSRDSATSQSPGPKPLQSPSNKHDQHYKRKNKSFEVGDEVELREVKNGRIILAAGKILGLSGKSTFHLQAIQPGYANIQVTQVFVPDAPLVVPNLNDDPPQRVLSDAVGSTVLWPEGSLRRASLFSKGA